jgi:peptidyl-prolyl cis-trans isomerase D
MLQKLRDQTQSLGFKILVAIIVFTLAVFGFGAFNLFVTGDPEVASVNGEGITQNQLARETERERRRLASRMGEDFDPGLIDPVQLQGSVLEQVIARTLLGQAADDLGIVVSRARVDDVVVRTPSFQINGEFQPELYRQAVQSMGYAPQEFLDDTAQLMALEQLQTGITDSAFLTRRELNVHAGLLGQRRDIAYLVFDAERFRDQVSVTDDEVRQYYDENQRAFETVESVDVAYVTLTRDDLLDDPALEISEDEVRGAYEAERAAAPPEESRRSRHILLEVGDARSAEEAVAELQALKARIEAGESFAELAQAASEDPGSAGQGGDLGFAGRGVFDPEFEEALFALAEPGDVSEPVATDFGFHLIQLEEVRRTPYPDFDSMRADIERELRREQAAELFAARLRELDGLAFEHPNDLQTIVDELGLQPQTVLGVTRDQGPAPFDTAAVRDRLFTDDVLRNRFNSAAVEYGDNRAVVMRVTDRHAPEPIPFDDVAQEIREEIELSRARTLAAQAYEEARERLESGASAAEIARDYAANWQTFELIRRNSTEIPRAVLQAAFALPRPGADSKSIGSTQMPSGGTALITVTRVQDGRADALTEAELEGMRNFLADRAARLEFTAFYETVRNKASVKRAQ